MTRGHLVPSGLAWLLAAVVCCPGASTAWAAEAAAGQATPDSSTPATTAQAPEQTPQAGAGERDGEPNEQALKQRTLGEAFRSFQPSEEISADNAVPFPVDI